MSTTQIVLSSAGIITTIVLFVIKYYIVDKPKPSIIICREIYRTSLVKTYPGILGNIDILYQNSRVSGLWLLSVSLHNTGSKGIKDAKLLMSFNQSTKILSWSIKEYPDESPLDSWSIEHSDADSKVVKFDHFNAAHHHKQTYEISFVCDGKPDHFTAVGSGDGWSVSDLVPKSGLEPKLLVPNWAVICLGFQFFIVAIGILIAFPVLHVESIFVVLWFILLFLFSSMFGNKMYNHFRTYYKFNVGNWIDYVRPK